jgi:hypothetical protein
MMKEESMKGFSKFCLVVLCAVILVSPVLAKKKQAIERYEATAMSLDAGRASIMEIGIFGWSSDQDRDALVQAFKEGGNQALYSALDKSDEMAFVSLPMTMGYQMRYCYQQTSGGKRIITLATDRPIALGEVMGDTTSQRDNISLVVLELDPQTGEGTGEMIVGAGLKINKKGQLEIETIAQDPIKFTKVKPMKVKDKK